MLRQAFTKAQTRAQSAGRALEGLNNELEVDEFSGRWYDYLANWKGVYTLLEQGSKETEASKAWFQGKKNERLSDDLLRYLYEARNDEEHGLDISVYRKDHHEVVFRTTKEITKPRFGFRNEGGRMVLVAPEGSEPLQYVPPGIALRPVTARSGNVIRPPEEHMGEYVDVTPIGVATAGLRYIEALLAEAQAYVSD